MTTINSQEDFLRALSENPEWRAAVRAQIVGEELLQLPARFDAFVERMDTFIEEQKQFNARLTTSVEKLTASVEQLTATVAKLTATVDEIKAFVKEQKELNERIIHRLDRINDDSSIFKGWLSRLGAIDDAPGMTLDMGMEYVRTLTKGELAQMAQRAAGGDISTDDLRSFRNADVVIEATLGGNPQYIAVEASYTADRRDTDRALRNAGFLTRFTGVPAHAAVVSVRNDRDLDPLIVPGIVYWHPIPDNYMEPE